MLTASPRERRSVSLVRGVAATCERTGSAKRAAAAQAGNARRLSRVKKSIRKLYVLAVPDVASRLCEQVVDEGQRLPAQDDFLERGENVWIELTSHILRHEPYCFARIERL